MDHRGDGEVMTRIAEVRVSGVSPTGVVTATTRGLVDWTFHLAEVYV